MSLEYVPGLAGVPAARSKICRIDGQAGVLSYRGYDIATLAENSTYEEVAYLLLRGHLPSKTELDEFIAELRNHRRLKFRIVDLLKTLPETGHPMDALVATLSAVGMFYPHSIMDSAEQRWGATVRILTKVPTMVAAYHRIRNGDEPIVPRDDLGHAANFIYMLTGKEPDELVAKMMDVALILHAEHGMNASTFAARVTGSTLADPYAVISAAIATLAGPLHGGANEDVLAMLRSIPGGVPGVRPFAEEQVKTKAKVAGFGHRVYKVKDPRAKILQGLVGQVFQKFGSHAALRHRGRARECHERAGRPEGRLPQRRFLQRHRLREAGHPQRPVHAHLRHRPHGRLAVPLAGAAGEQPDLPAGADLRRRA